VWHHRVRPPWRHKTLHLRDFAQKSDADVLLISGRVCGLAQGTVGEYRAGARRTRWPLDGWAVVEHYVGVGVDSDIARVGSAVKTRLGAVEQAEPQPPMFWFRDPDGNQLLLVQPHLT
jgi:hypothetical protein